MEYISREEAFSLLRMYSYKRNHEKIFRGGLNDRKDNEK